MKKLLIPLMLIPFLASCGGQTKKEWKEISREEAIKLEAQILNNFKAPKFYTSTVEFQRGSDFTYTGEAEGFSVSKQFYRSIDMGVTADGPRIDAYLYRVIENELWSLDAHGYEKPKSEQTRYKRKIDTKNPLEDLKDYVLRGYSEQIENFENFVEKISLGHMEGEYSFYSYDNKSLKGIIKYKETSGRKSNMEMQIAFEKEKPSSVLINRVSTEEPENSMYGTITFNYSKQPTVPSDANPDDWCD